MEAAKSAEVPAIAGIMTSDENVMRHVSRALNTTESENIREIKDRGLIFHAYLSALGSSREISLAKTKIEEAVMWAVKHITR